MQPDWDEALARAEAHSPYLAMLIRRQPELVARLKADGPEAALAMGAAEEADTPTRLRQEKAAVALVTAIADLAGVWPLETVTGTLSRFADRALDAAIVAALQERVPDAEPQGFAVIALGKQGSFELNYSSDLDPILIYDPDRLPCRPREEPAEAAVRLARRVVEIMHGRQNGDGYVFRVDLRLRPNAEVTPIALSVGAAISYYESAALPWERAAFIRARAAAGDVALGQSFLDMVKPFVWRRALDFTAIREIRAISNRVRDHYAQGQELGPGFDLKRGRGGIREVEFYAQIQQMIFGGRDPALRVPATLDALAALAAAGHVDAGDAGMMGEAYRLYRTVEHRLQMVDDRQTHSLPKDPAALDNVAQLGGWTNGAALIADLAGPTRTVAATYAMLLAPEDEVGLGSDTASVADHLASLGLDPDLAARIERWRSYDARSLRTAAAREAFEVVLPVLLEAAARTPSPNDTLVRFERFLERLPSGAQFFQLLKSNKRLVSLLARLLGLAPSLAEELAARPALIDGLLDASAFQPMPPVEELAAELGAGAPPFEELLDQVRRRVGERRFALGVQLIEAITDPLEVAAGYARIAEAAVRVLTEAVETSFAERHGHVPGGRLSVLGLGRLGGAALTAASDLDLIYLFSGDFSVESDGAKPLAATLYFNRLAQRVTAALSAPTAAGPLYEVDTRLRPSGSQGLLAVSIDSFDQYQRENAWTWEHMALARARIVHGTAEDRAAIGAIIDMALHQVRDPGQLGDDVVKMRSEISTHKPPAGPLDVKLIEGGLVDLEFVVHHLQLRTRTGLSPFLGEAVSGLVAAGLAPAGLRAAHDLMTRFLVTMRLVAPAAAEARDLTPDVQALVARAAGCGDWASLMRDYDQARALVSTLWAEQTGGKRNG